MVYTAQVHKNSYTGKRQKLPQPPRMRVCIIGTGVSGIAAIKCCLEAGLEPVAFERSPDLGGLWRFTDVVDGKACVMRTTMMNTSKEMSAFSDFPPPAEFSNFLHNGRVLEYVGAYVDRFDLRRWVKFSTEVVKARRQADSGKWLVAYRSVPASQDGRHQGQQEAEAETKCETFDAVWVCTGHHAVPNVPAYPGADSFPAGQAVHTHACRDPLAPGFAGGKAALVVGAGNSAGDATVELSHVAKVVYWSTRRGTWVSHRVTDHGWPKDLVFARRWRLCLNRLLGGRLISWQLERMMQSRVDHDLYGLRPAHGPLQQHTFVNDEMPNRLAAGLVRVKPDVARIEGRRITFVDDSSADVDVIVYGTGYRIAFPFLDSSQFAVSANETRLYKHVFHPGVPCGSLAFIGFVQPLGATIPIAEMQCRWAARVVKGDCRLPTSAAMETEAEHRRRAVAQRFVNTPRHTIQVDWIPYMDELATEIGCRPPLLRLLLTDPALFRAVFFQPCTPYQYRLAGPHRWPGARRAILGQMERVLCGMRGGGGGDIKASSKSGGSVAAWLTGAAAVAVSMAAACWLLKRGAVFSDLLDYRI